MDMSKQDDLALIRQVQHGNEVAIEEFYHRFAPGLYAFIRRSIREPVDIEDVLAETMAAAVTAIMRFQGQSQVFTWLCQIAKFKLADYYRRRNEETLPLNEEIAASSFSESDLETNLLIRQTLYKLNHIYRQVLEEKYFAGYSVKEIALHIAKSEKAVESILIRARQAFIHEYRRMSPEKEV